MFAAGGAKLFSERGNILQHPPQTLLGSCLSNVPVFGKTWVCRCKVNKKMLEMQIFLHFFFRGHKGVRNLCALTDLPCALVPGMVFEYLLTEHRGVDMGVYLRSAYALVA